jgi:predicted transcriptional regulator
MKHVEKAILRFLSEHKIWITPNNIAKNTGYSRGYIKQECRNLLDDGYIESANQPSDPSYRITDVGREYLQLED